jgi:hypothetical protein
MNHWCVPGEGVDEAGPMGERIDPSPNVVARGDRMSVSPTAAFAVTAIVLAAVSLTPDRSSAQDRAQRSVDAHAQSQEETARPRTRLRVTPRYPYRTESLPYPPPYPIEYPGPGYMRQCKSHLVQEARPSGTVIVQRTQCWWERGQGQL